MKQPPHSPTHQLALYDVEVIAGEEDPRVGRKDHLVAGNGGGVLWGDRVGKGVVRQACRGLLTLTPKGWTSPAARPLQLTKSL